MNLSLDDALRSISRRASHSYQVGSWTSGRIEVRGIGSRAGEQGSYAGGTYRHLLGCITKMMTATLIARAVAEGRLRLDEECLSLISDFSRDVRCAKLLEGVRIHHLLNHSHGIDDSGFGTAPFDGDAIDLHQILSCPHLKRFAAPGNISTTAASVVGWPR